MLIEFNKEVKETVLGFFMFLTCIGLFACLNETNKLDNIYKIEKLKVESQKSK